MTVGFYSGTSTGPNDLIDKLRLALIDQSWTVDAFASVGAGYQLHVHKTLGGEASYFNFRSAIAETGTTLITEDNAASTAGTVTGLIMNGSTGYDAGALWHKQTGYPQNIDQSNQSFGVVMSPMSISAIPAYYFFFVGNSVHIVVEITAGKFQFMSFGMLNKDGAGAFTGGQYFTGSLSSKAPATDYASSWYAPLYFAALRAGHAQGAVYVDVDSVADWRVAQGDSYPEIRYPCVVGQQAKDNYSTDGLCTFFWLRSPSFYNAMSAMCPLYTMVKRSDDNYSLLGWPEGVRFLNVTNYTPAQEITYGSETWMVFHADSQSPDPMNMYCGFAFLKDDGS